MEATNQLFRSADQAALTTLPKPRAATSRSCRPETNTYTSTIKAQAGEASVRFSVPSFSAGGFVIAAIDKQSGFLYDSYLLSTNDKDPAKAAAEMQRPASFLYISPHDCILMVTTVGKAIRRSTPFPVTSALFDALSKVGATGYRLRNLSTTQSNGRPHTYTLITSNDPSYPYDEVIEQSSLWAEQEETGAVQGLFSHLSAF